MAEPGPLDAVAVVDLGVCRTRQVAEDDGHLVPAAACDRADRAGGVGGLGGVIGAGPDHPADVVDLPGHTAEFGSEGAQDVVVLAGGGQQAGQPLPRGLPAVILEDLKTRYTEQYPFSTFYDELHRKLSTESLVVVGGYSFGDCPLNRALARFLSRNTQNRLLVWNPAGTPDAYLGRLRKQLLDKEHPISEEQISMEQVWLPDAEALRRLGPRLHPGGESWRDEDDGRRPDAA